MSVFARARTPTAPGPDSREELPFGPLAPSPGAPAQRAPHVAILDVDVAEGLPAIPGHDEHGRRWSAALVLVRVFTEPVGVLELAPPADGVSARELARAIASTLGGRVGARILAAGLEWQGDVPSDGLEPAQAPPYLAARELVLAQAPSLTVAICTRNRPAGLAKCLASIVGQEYPSLRVLVVDNDPSDDSAQAVAREYESRLALDYVREPRPGLSWARNRAIDASDAEILAWIDDDEELADPWWAAEVARAFVEHPEAGAASGMILPAEIETASQLQFEQYGGHSKGRDFTREVFAAAGPGAQHPLYPLPPFGTGGNMAFRRDAMELIGRFDPALGAGTKTLAGEDTAAFSALLYLGGTVVWQPSAIVRHWHRREPDALAKLFHGYGRGLTAYYASMLARHPSTLPRLLGLAPRALVDFVSPHGARLSGLASDFPRDLLRVHRRGVFEGPGMYVRARRHARRLRDGGGVSRQTGGRPA
ncbi:MAG TPA: glycosyltransferase [Solirubrobacteraceae bacterium]|nr:glycosyltransferase [Solirubrobacteraceae bacterium]